MSRKVFFFGSLVLLITLGFVAAINASPSEQACSGFNSRLRVGQQARVIPQTSANNIRSSASRDANRVGSIPAGGVFSVLEGPRCANGLTWWRVDYQGIVGWTAEGEGSTPWVEPYTSASGGSSGQTIPAGGRIVRLSPIDALRGTAESGGGGGDVYLYGPGGTSASCLTRNGQTFTLDWSSPFPEPICLASPATNAVAVSPTGISILPALYHPNFSGQPYDYYLPLPAFLQPGTWTVRAGGNTITYIVRPHDGRQIKLFDENSNTLLLMGLEPGERVIAMSVFTQDIYMLTADNTGSFVGSFNDFIDVVVGEYAGVIEEGQFASLRTNGGITYSNADVSAYLYNYYFG